MGVGLLPTLPYGEGKPIYIYIYITYPWGLACSPHSPMERENPSTAMSPKLPRPR